MAYQELVIKYAIRKGHINKNVSRIIRSEVEFVSPEEIRVSCDLAAQNTF